MAMILMEGFDHLQASLFTTKGWSSNAAAVVAGRLGGNAFQASGSGGATTPQKALPSTYATLFAGFAFNFSAGFGAADFIFILRATGGTVNTFGVRLNAANKLEIVNSSNTVIATGTTVLNANTWYYIEVKAVIAGAAGSCELHLNGVSGEIASTTGNFGSTNIDTVTLRGRSQAGLLENWDDLYVCDSSGSTNNTFLGDFAIETKFPSADGAHTDWTPNSGSPHFSRVNEHTGTFPDGDTSYVSDATVGHRDSYAVDDMVALAGTVFAVQTNLYARKDDAGVRQIAAVARPGSTDRDGGTVTLTTSYVDYTEIRETNPDTSAAWTISDINASEFGIKTVA